jgi:coiled-coil and C2 domain-containing protein 2A
MDKRMNDAICQMKNIGCVIGSDNIWANIQEYDDPGLTNYNLNLTNAWKPFFTKNNFKKFFPGESIVAE